MNKLAGVSLLGDAAALLLGGLGVVLAAVARGRGKAHRLHWLPRREGLARARTRVRACWRRGDWLLTLPGSCCAALRAACTAS